MIKHSATRLVVPAIFSMALLVAMALVMTQQAHAASFKYRVPPYSNPWSYPKNSCVGDLVNGDRTCGYSDTSGIAKTYARSWGLSKLGAARHNGDPPVANPDMYITSYKNLYFYSLLHGKFKIRTDSSPCCLVSGGEERYGGWTAMLRTADNTWVKDYYFYVYKKKECPGSCGSTTYTIPSTNVIFVKGYNAGHYSIASLFDSYAWGMIGDEQTAVYGLVDSHTTSSGYAMYSDQLAIQWCDSGTC